MDWSYIAGFFDGEGCVPEVRGAYYVTASQSISQSKVLHDIKEFLKERGVATRLHKHLSRNPKHQDVDVLVVAEIKSVCIFLENVLPFAIVKAEKMKVALEAMQKKRNANAERDEIREQAVVEYQGGISINKLCGKYGMSNTSFKELLIRRGVQIRDFRKAVKMGCVERKRKYPEEVLQSAYALYRAGMSQVEVGKRTGIHHGTLRAYMRRCGYTARSSQRNQAL